MDRIVSDSGCDLTPELQNELVVDTVPLSMTLGDEVYVDNETLDVPDFISKMREYKDLPKSACPSPYDFMEKCKKDVTNFIVTLSSKLSGSYDSANVAKSMLDEKGIDAYVFDSKSASAGQLLIVMKLRELINKGFPKVDIIAKIEAFIKEMRTFFVLENLDNLIKNGRMSKVTGLIAGVLNIRPILGSNGNGEIVLFAKPRGVQKSIQRLTEMIGEMCQDTSDRILTITHCNNIELVNKLKGMVGEKYAFKDIVVAPTKGLSGMYANDGGIIIAF